MSRARHIILKSARRKRKLRKATRCVPFYADRVVQNLNSMHKYMNPQSVTDLVMFVRDGMTLPFVARYKAQRIPGIDEETLRSLYRQAESEIRLESMKETIRREIEAVEDTEMCYVLQNSLEAAKTLIQVERVRKSVISRKDKARQTELRIAVADSNAVNRCKILLSCCANDCDHLAVQSGQTLNHIVVVLAEKLFADPDCMNLGRIILKRQYPEVERMKPHQWLAFKRVTGSQTGLFPIDASAITDLLNHLYRAWAPPTVRIKSLSGHLVMDPKSCLRWFVEGIKSSITKFIIPTIRAEWEAELDRKADEVSMQSFRANLMEKLLQPGVSVTGVVFGIDPGLASGCKVAVFDTCKDAVVACFKFNAIQNNVNITTFANYMSKHMPVLIICGDGTGSIELQNFLRETVPEVDVCIVCETGASVYSISELAMVELPEMSVEYRGCVSIVRRALDPLSEYVKIEPRHLSAGMYQHDMPIDRLNDSLRELVTECVALIGVDLNRASEQILQFVPGLNRVKARAIIKHRQEMGRGFRNRKELLEVREIGRNTWTQAVGFVKVYNSDWTPLDSTAVHPDDYVVANTVLRNHPEFKHLVCDRIPSSPDPISQDTESFLLQLLTLCDPRESRPAPPIKKAKDLKFGTPANVEGNILKGVVRNVTSFGAFVNVFEGTGLKDDGLLHISEYPIGVSDPYYYSVNQEIKVRVLCTKQDGKKIRIQLSARVYLSRIVSTHQTPQLSIYQLPVQYPHSQET